MLSPAVNIPLRANGDKAWFGWPTDPKLEELIDAWFKAPDLGRAEEARRRDPGRGLYRRRPLRADRPVRRADRLPQEPRRHHHRPGRLPVERREEMTSASVPSSPRKRGPRAAALRAGGPGIPLSRDDESALSRCSPTSSGASWRPSRSWRWSRSSSSRCLHLSPGDPAAIIAGDTATADDIARIRAKLGLDQPLYIQFGDLGVGACCTAISASRSSPTCRSSKLIAAAGRADRRADHRDADRLGRWRRSRWACSRRGRPARGSTASVMVFAVLGFSVPVFVLAYLLDLRLRDLGRSAAGAGLCQHHATASGRSCRTSSCRASRSA